MPESKKNFHSLIAKSKMPLIIVPDSPSDDCLVSAFALHRYLKKKNIESALVTTAEIPSRLSFLEPPGETLSDLTGSRDFLLIFNTKFNKIIEVKSEQKEEEFIVRITPEKGSINPRDFSFVPAEFCYDLVIVLGAESLGNIGSLHEQNTDLFFEVPKINIDFHSANENFGQVNLVDMTASGVSEIVAQTILEKDEKIMDQKIAQSLLTGIISATESFQKPNTTPRAMMLAANLMKFKADQSTVIRHLYKTKSLSFLKLWGRVMARMEFDEKLHFAWSLVSSEDFVRSRSSEKDIPSILEELRKNYFQGKVFAVFHRSDDKKTKGEVFFADPAQAAKVAHLYDVDPAGKQKLSLHFPDLDLLQTEKDFLQKLTTASESIEPADLV